MPARKHTPEQIAEAVAYWKEHGPAAASRKFGIPRTTIIAWGRELGVRRMDVETAQAKTAVMRATNDQRRAALATRLLEVAQTQLEEVERGGVLYHWGTTSYREGNATTTETTFMEQKVPAIPTADRVNLMRVVGIAIDKANVLDGKATTIQGVMGSAADKRKAAEDLRERLSQRLGVIHGGKSAAEG